MIKFLSLVKQNKTTQSYTCDQCRSYFQNGWTTAIYVYWCCIKISQIFTVCLLDISLTAVNCWMISTLINKILIRNVSQLFNCLTCILAGVFKSGIFIVQSTLYKGCSPLKCQPKGQEGKQLFPSLSELGSITLKVINYFQIHWHFYQLLAITITLIF